MIETRTWDAAEHLENEEDMAAYLDAALEDGDAALVVAALGDIARAKGISQITQTPVHIGNVVRNAVVFNFQNWVGESTLTNPDSLLETVPRLFALLDSRQVNYVLVGGVALLTYVEGRNTEDIDLIMALPSLKKWDGSIMGWNRLTLLAP